MRRRSALWTSRATAFLAVALLAFAGVKSPVMQAAMAAGADRADCGMTVAEMAAMGGMAADPFAPTPEKAPAKPPKPAGAALCAFCVDAAHAPLVPGADEQTRQRALGAIGDSAIVDAFGSGAMARDLAPLTAQRLAQTCSEHGRAFPGKLLECPHPRLLKSQAYRTGLDARQVCRLELGPVISLGVLDKQGLCGRLDGGFFFSPLKPFQAALEALEATDASA